MKEISAQSKLDARISRFKDSLVSGFASGVPEEDDFAFVVDEL